ncbi:MmgE/PrpD family protein [Bradyrhizobium sp. BR 10289]|uniref:MmgE/PrpD family protein n=1 Tax=Bradyrhizobium sp. BR 10289 TaxID=2749993 RepID=UPI001C6502F6|nr:MmgE/PrpD family protein [Bradyrhizobium sp. BR 10289]MBW7970244.1 MmgE/PrpD family protein [Bradyrhizobium sp. BR 10289]
MDAFKEQVSSQREWQSARFADFAIGLTLSEVPAAVQDLAKRHWLDTLGVAIASSAFAFGRVALEGVRELGTGSDATAIGSGAMLPAASAALVNGVLAHGLDFDDTHIGGIYHASAPALATVLAVGEAKKTRGRDALLAFIAAIEIGCRLAIAGAGDFTRRNFHATAVCGTFAAAAAAGRLSGATRPQLVSAFGLCGSMASGILETGESWLKRLHPGWSAHAGVVAAALGRVGFIGPDTVLEGRRGFYAAHIGHVPDPLPGHQLGAEWRAIGLALKPYPCCHVIHAFVDAAFELRDQFALGDVERIECKLTREWLSLVTEPRADCIRPANAYRALFSVQYVVGLALARGRVDLAAFYDEPLDAPDVLAIAEKTWCVDDPESDYPAHFPGEMIVHLRNGRVLSSRKPWSLGTPEWPISQADLEAKFMANATRVVSTRAAERLAEAVMHLEDADSLQEIMSLSTAAQAPH